MTPHENKELEEEKLIESFPLFLLLTKSKTTIMPFR